MKHKPATQKSWPPAKAKRTSRSLSDLFPKLVKQANPLTPHPLPTEEHTQILLRKQSNFMSHWIDFA